MITWLLAFLLHSTLWCGFAWIVLRLRPTLHPRIREAIWYTAIAASLLTPTAQLLTSNQSSLWQIRLPESILAQSQHTERESNEQNASLNPLITASDNEERTYIYQSQIINYAWFAIAGLLLLRYTINVTSLNTRLRKRKSVTNINTKQKLTELSDKAQLSNIPRLTTSQSLGSPIAIGLGKNTEICIPNRALLELDDQQIDAILAHEIAHHIRRDTIRLFTLNLIRSIFFFQPLFHIASRDLHLAAEQQCDEWAATQINDPITMASCLTEVATWIIPKDKHIPVACMARRHSGLRSRVERLISPAASSKQAPAKRYCLLFSILIILSITSFAPAISMIEAEHSDDMDSLRNAPTLRSEHSNEYSEHQETTYNEHERRENSNSIGNEHR
ncbi:Regulatory protein BlaR1 [Poriferisphaera corsica]|uniref:Regulatory protein BlaR1 n=1 Tax=Poriferisphaera corsica TaxID=2528020 RepID=A0A517YTS5_9BACT|nr:M56 family metallopeptidase [Poriferisphaera corsica]QDU33618.1 Regulatory protein BlaR1 [Poriferisphaera corsica]